MARKAEIHYGHVDMVKFKSKVDQYSKEYYEGLVRLFKDAAAEFVWRTVQRVSVDTGMSAASLEPLAQEVGTTILPEFSSFIKRSQRSWGTAMSGLSQKGRIRSVDAGFRAGQSAYHFRFGSVKNPYFVFEFKINVWQYAFWEGNWQSLEEGIEWFVDFIESNYQEYLPSNLPDVLNAYTGIK